ncbi:hypothetical protein JCM8547_003874 [Rhodosporidiobolus lusitaniae]
MAEPPLTLSSEAFAPPPSLQAGANTATPPDSDAVVSHYARLFERSLVDLRSCIKEQRFDPQETGRQSEFASWEDLRADLVKEWRTPGAMQNEEEAEGVLLDMEELGAEKMARDAVQADREALRDEGADGEKLWKGTAGVISWMARVRSVLQREDKKEQVDEQPLHDLNGPSTNGHVYPTFPTSLNMPAPTSSSSTMNPARIFVSPSELSFPSTAAAAHVVAPVEQSEAVNGFAPPPSEPLPPPKKKKARASAPPAPLSATATASSAMLVGELDPSPSSNPTFVSNFLPSSSTASAPPKAKKPRLSSTTASSSSAPPKPPRRTLDGRLKQKGASEVYVPPAPTGESSRPQRKRKLPGRLTFEQSSDPLDEEDGGAYLPAKASKAAKGKVRASVASAVAVGDEEEIDELASDYEEEKEPTPVAAREEEEEGRFPVGSTVLSKFPNYHFFPSVVLDPRTAPSNTQGKRVKGAYLVKSIPTGADHRWVPPEESHIKPIPPSLLDEIDAAKYSTPPPQSWIKWRADLVEAARLIRDPEGLKDWLSRPTDFEVRIEAEQERKRIAKQMQAW